MDRKQNTSLIQDAKLSLLLFGLMFYWLSWRIECCSQHTETQPNLATTVSNADRIVYGTVISKNDIIYLEKSFIATMEVFCVFKGDAVPRFINITNQGLVGGTCFFNNLTVNSSYIIYMNPFEVDPYIFSETEIKVENISDPFIAELTNVCKLATLYPIGMDQSSSNVQCPQTSKEPDCVLPDGSATPDVTSDLPPLKDVNQTSAKVPCPLTDPDCVLYNGSVPLDVTSDLPPLKDLDLDKKEDKKDAQTTDSLNTSPSFGATTVISLFLIIAWALLS